MRLTLLVSVMVAVVVMLFYVSVKSRAGTRKTPTSLARRHPAHRQLATVPDPKKGKLRVRRPPALSTGIAHTQKADDLLSFLDLHPELMSSKNRSSPPTKSFISAVKTTVCPAEDSSSAGISPKCVFEGLHELSKKKLETIRKRGAKDETKTALSQIHQLEQSLHRLETKKQRSLAPKPKKHHGQKMIRTQAPVVQRLRVFGGII